MLDRRGVAILAVITGVVMELGIQAASGRHEAWDSSLYWTVGMPMAGAVAFALGMLARSRDWLLAFLIVPAQVTTMMVRSGGISGLWPLAMILAVIFSAPFVAIAFIGSLFRTKNGEPRT